MTTLLQSLDDARSAALDGICAPLSDWVRVTENIDAAFERLRTTVLRVEADAMERAARICEEQLGNVHGLTTIRCASAIRAAIPQSGKGET